MEASEGSRAGWKKRWEAAVSDFRKSGNPEDLDLDNISDLFLRPSEWYNCPVPAFNDRCRGPYHDDAERIQLVKAIDNCLQLSNLSTFGTNAEAPPPSGVGVVFGFRPVPVPLPNEIRNLREFANDVIGLQETFSCIEEIEVLLPTLSDPLHVRLGSSVAEGDISDLKGRIALLEALPATLLEQLQR